MKIIRKTGMILSMALVMLFGIKAEAADSQGDAIYAKAVETMQQVKVLGAKVSIKNSQTMQYEEAVKIGADMNAGVFYFNLMGAEMWTDEKEGMVYTYDPKTGKYYFELANAEDSQPEKTIEEELKADDAMTITYLGEEGNCYKLNVVSKDGMTEMICYIDKNTYLFSKAESKNNIDNGQTKQVIESIIEFEYPASIVIPDVVKQKAELAEGAEFAKSNISYRAEAVKGKTVLYVTQSKNAKNKVKIPDSVAIKGKEYKVYGIDAKAFYNNSKIKSVVIGNNVKTIGDKAFYNNKKMTSATIGKNVRTIGKQSFYNCKVLKTVKINSKSISKIGSKAFYKNAKTLKFKVPKKKAAKYKKLIEKSKVSSKLVISKY